MTIKRQIVLPARLLISCLLLLLASGCASYGVINNQPVKAPSEGEPYSLQTWAESRSSDYVFMLTFSGGGTRAAAMAYGVLKKLRDTKVVVDGKPTRLLDKVSHISSVSGGSFTAAYYGLYGDRIFTDYEDEFLRKDVESHLTWSILRPIHWFSRKGRTDRAMEYYDKILFHGATFADMMETSRPMVIINTSDLAYGVRFSFVQDYFRLLCSDLRSFPVTSAVTASSAVPVVFNPVVIENYSGCPDPVWPDHTQALMKQSNEFAQMMTGLESYNEKDTRKYIHFVDGGITDNMGLRAMSDIIEVAGGPRKLISKTHRKIPKYVIVLSVNASTEKRLDMDASPKQPSMIASMNAMTDIQLHRYNAATVDEVRSDLRKWTAEISTPEHPVNLYFIEVGFRQVSQNQLRLFLNKIPTSFSLEDDQVDALISSAGDVLSADPEFQRLLQDISSQ